MPVQHCTTDDKMMKTIYFLLTCLCLTSIATGQGAKGNPTKADPIKVNSDKGSPHRDKKPASHLIMVPPWRAKAGALNQISKVAAKAQLDQWALTQTAIFPGGVIPFRPRVVEFTKPGILVFTADLDTKQADLIQSVFKYDAGKATQIEFFVSKNLIYEPSPIKERPLIPVGSTNPGDAASRIITNPENGQSEEPPCYVTPEGAITSFWTASTPLTLQNNRRPVLYVVDTGVQPLVQTLAAGYHPEYNIASSGRVQMIQGRVPSGGGIGTWSPPYTSSPPTPSVWNNAVDSPLAIGSSDYPTSTPSGALNPQLDTHSHGTKIASVAVGMATGVLGKTIGPNVDVQSIRIYDSSNTYTVDAIDGIAQVIERHIDRQAASAPAESTGANTASVLLFASRTTSGFDQILEVTMWWAWYQNVICIAAGGNTTTPYTGSGSTAKYSPDSLWYTNSTGGLPAAQPTSPARFDWVEANANPSRWPSWSDAPAGNPRPNSPYLIIVGGYSGTDANVWWSGSSKGPEIDLLAPAVDVPCAKQVKATQFVADDCLVLASGTSLSAGIVAGVALVYVANKSTNPTPTDFRNWLLPASISATNTSPVNPTSQTHQHATGQTRRVGYGTISPTTNPTTASGKGKYVPRLAIKPATTW